MITQTIIDWLANAVASILGLIPNFTLPTWYSGAVNWWANTITGAASLDPWLNLGAVYNGAMLIFGSIALAIGIKITRIALSFITLGGGSAA